MKLLAFLRSIATIVIVAIIVDLNIGMWWYWLPFELTKWYHENSPGRFWVQ